MAERIPGFTRVASLGPIDDVVDQLGGRLERALAQAEVPEGVLTTPELPIPLQSQFRLLDACARETGDACFGARLGAQARAHELSDFGRWVTGAERLDRAIARTHFGLSQLLQTSTLLRLTPSGPTTNWSISFTEPEPIGRDQNEMLALGYFLDLVRSYCGQAWTPERISITLQPGLGLKTQFEDIFKCDVVMGATVCSTDFPTAILKSSSVQRERRQHPSLRVATHCGADLVVRDGALPLPEDGQRVIEAVIRARSYGSYPNATDVARQLGWSKRTLQRRLVARGTTFSEVVQSILTERAKQLLADPNTTVSNVAFDVGYSDVAHFSRAFSRWAGVSPSEYKAQVGWRPS